jgi:D-serine deaminase-like pyridoxal phosphate-dependent protein
MLTFLKLTTGPEYCLLILTNIFHYFCFREAGLLMTSNTRRQVVVSTLAEAQFYFENGFDDITYAYPLSFEKLPRCAEFLSKLELFHIAVDNMEIIDALGKYVLPESCKKWSVLLMVDCGYGRGNYS